MTAGVLGGLRRYGAIDSGSVGALSKLNRRENKPRRTVKVKKSADKLSRVRVVR